METSTLRVGYRDAGCHHGCRVMTRPVHVIRVIEWTDQTSCITRLVNLDIKISSRRDYFVHIY
jgi:hypothetical protein